MPRQFKVYASERYIPSSSGNSWPSKYFIGTFEASNTRNIQSFLIKDTLESKQEVSSVETGQEKIGLVVETQVIMYAKYVKFEMLSHYGNEHFCPLSLVRIFGTSISDDEEVVNEIAEVVETTTTIKESNSLPKTLDEIKKESKSEDKKPKILNLPSLFLSNIISVLLGENFNLPNLFSSLKTLNLNEINNRINRPSKSTRIVENNSVARLSTPINYLNLSPSNNQRNLIFQMDMHKLLCFSSSNSNLECCQCIKPSGKKVSIKKFYSTKRSFNFYSNSADSLMPKYCGYYYLMMTAAQTRSNNTLLSKYLANMKYTFKEDENITLSSYKQTDFAQISINNMNYYILNEWLDNQTLSIRNQYEPSEKPKLEPNLKVVNLSENKIEPEKILNEVKKETIDLDLVNEKNRRMLFLKKILKRVQVKK